MHPLQAKPVIFSPRSPSTETPDIFVDVKVGLACNMSCGHMALYSRRRWDLHRGHSMIA